MKRILWVTWQEHRRNLPIAEAIGAEFHEILVDGPKPLRWLTCVVRTAALYWTRPDVVICMNPSEVLALFTVLARPLFGYRAGIDTHNFGLGLEDRTPMRRRIARFLMRRADFIIVTNPALAEHVERHGGRPVVVPDRIPDIPPPAAEAEKSERPSHRVNLLFICTFAEDEPYLEVFEAARLLYEQHASGQTPDIGIWVTGRYQAHVDPSDHTPNLHFLGYLSNEAYDRILHRVDGVIDLTTREHCLVCGAYESVAVGKPMVLSDTAALRTHFHRGAVYSGNERHALAASMKALAADLSQLTEQAGQLQTILQADWERSRNALEQVVLGR